jgi:hypothetical protein
MWNSTKNSQDEKDQQKTEVILEEQHRGILDRSHLLLNTIFVILGVYAVILVSIYPPTLGNNFTESNQVNVSENITHVQQFPFIKDIIDIFSTLNAHSSVIAYISLCFSLSSLLIALTYVWRSFHTNDQSFIAKLEKKYSCSIKVNFTSINCIFCKIDETDFLIHLKNGKELIDRNKRLYEINKDLITYNDNSINAIVISILSFIVFFSAAEHSISLFFGFLIIFLILLCIIPKVDNYQKSRKKNRN